MISIHALLAESDHPAPVPRRPHADISIHALLAESDLQSTQSCDLPIRFLSTLSLRRATPGPKSRTPDKYYFYPRSPCGERHNTDLRECLRPDFYPRSPCGERPYSQHVKRPSGYFYPRSPCGERRLDVTIIGRTWDISIHALLAESDIKSAPMKPARLLFLSTLSLRRATVAPVLAVGRARYFYPRSPCGERRCWS